MCSPNPLRPWVPGGPDPFDGQPNFDLTETAVRQWVVQAERDAGTRAEGLTTDEREELVRLRW
jgi:hypothetical protein